MIVAPVRSTYGSHYSARACYSARAYGKAVPLYVSSLHLRRLIVSEMSYSSTSQPGRRESSTA